MTRKEALLNAAKSLFAAHGYEGTTFKKISQHAGVALGLLSHHYGTKEQLFHVACVDVLDKLYIHISNETKNGKNGLDRVMRFCESYLHYSMDKNACYSLLTYCTPYINANDEARAILKDCYMRIFQLLNTLVEEGRQDGSIKASTPASTAETLICTLIGLCQALKILPVDTPFLGRDVLAIVKKSLEPVTEE